jgi:hypothetical protein
VGRDCREVSRNDPQRRDLRRQEANRFPRRHKEDSCVGWLRRDLHERVDGLQVWQIRRVLLPLLQNERDEVDRSQLGHWARYSTNADERRWGALDQQQSVPAALIKVAAGTREPQLSRCTIGQLIEKPELPNLPPLGPVINPSCTNVRTWNSSRT